MITTLKPFLISLAIIATLFLSVGTAFAAPYFRQEMGLVPVNDSESYLGTTTPSLRAWLRVIADSFYDTDASDGCAQWASNVLTSTGSACGSGGSGGNSKWATSTASDITPNGAGGIMVFSSSTISRLSVASGTTTNATSTNQAISNLFTFNGVTGSTWASFCTSITGHADLCDGGDATGGGGSFPFTTATTYSTTTNSTTTPLWMKGNQFSLFASSTSVFDNASTSLLNVFGEVDLDTYTSALLLTGSTGVVAEYAGTTCTNQFVRVLSALGVATCATVGTADVAGLDISDDTNLTAGDALTLTDDDIDFDGGATPQGELGNTWASPTLDDNVTTTGWTLGNFLFTNATGTAATTTSLWSTLSLGNEGRFVFVTATGTAATSTFANAVAITANNPTGTSAENTTDGTLNIQNTISPNIGLQVYSNIGATMDSPLVLFRSDNTAADDGVLRIMQDGTAGGAYNIRMDGPAPQIEMVESDQAAPAGKFETGVNADLFYIAGRDSGDSTFELGYTFERLASGGLFTVLGTDASIFTGGIQANASSTFQNFTGVNATTSSATTTNFFATTASTTNFFGAGLSGGSGCAGSTFLQYDGAGKFGCGTPAGGGTPDSKFATSTGIFTNAIYPSGGVNTHIGIGTTTPAWTLQIASSTKSQLTLSDPSVLTNNHWSFRNAGGNLYLATSSPTTFATTSSNSVTISPASDGCSGLKLATTTPCAAGTVFASSGFIYMHDLTGATAGTNSDLCISTTPNQLIEESTGTCIVSSRKYKHNIETLDLSAIGTIMNLRPVSFATNENQSFDFEDTQYGFIAEEVAEADPHLAKYANGEPRTLDDWAILSVAVKAIQELYGKIINHESRLDALERENKELRAMIENLQ